MKTHPDLSDMDQLPMHNEPSAVAQRGLVGEPIQVLEDVELYKYKYLRERAQKLQLIAEKYAAMSSSVLRDSNAVGAELGKYMDVLAEKYQVNLHVYTITEEGQIVPIPNVDSQR